MRVFIYSAGQDTGGVGVAIKHGLDLFEPKVSARFMCASETYIEYPTDLLYDARTCADLARDADVLHLMNTLSLLRRQRCGTRAVVLHHHGTRFRNGHAACAAEARRFGAIQLASTLDLAILEPDVSWLPSPYDLEVMATFRSPRHDGVIRIAHSPTVRSIKGTEDIIAAVRSLSRRYPVAARPDRTDAVGRVSEAQGPGRHLRRPADPGLRQQCDRGLGHGAPRRVRRRR